MVAVSVRRMIIDCDTCTVRGAACADCVVTFLTIPVRAATGPLGGPTSPEPSSARVDLPAGLAPVGMPGDAQPRPVELDAAEREAIGVLAASGLVPPLRMVRAV